LPVRSRFLTRLSVVIFLACNGCAYHGAASTDIENPAVQKVAWFSFLDGHDIREACAPLVGGAVADAPAHYRLVYNGQYSEQIRAYEIVGGTSSGGTLTARAKGHSSLSDWWIAGTQDLLAPWRWHESTAALSADEVVQFRAALAGSGFGSGAPQGLRLSSQDFYWVAAGCEAGQFHYYAWVEQDGSLDAAKFQDFLLRHDGTGLPFRPSRVLNADERQRLGTAHGRNFNGEFTLEVHGEGLGGLVNAF
jgi:hypothetical protein